MVDNQHKKISGYRELNDRDIALINRVKAMENDVANLWFHVSEEASDPDRRWLAVSRTHIQEGFSALVHAVARPKDPFDD